MYRGYVCAVFVLALSVMLGGAAATAQSGDEVRSAEDVLASIASGSQVSASDTGITARGAEADRIKVVASGLDNPRGLAFGPNRTLYVAEAGRAGSECVGSGEEQTCYGNTGAITRIKGGDQATIIKGLPSVGEPGGFAASGPHDIAFTSVAGAAQSDAYLAVGGGPRSENGDNRFARLLKLDPVRRGEEPVRIADFRAYEFANNPDGEDKDSNPYSVAAIPATQLVADAAANTLLKLDAARRVSTVATFPTRPVENPEDFGLPPGFRYQSVPNSVAVGSDGSYFVGELTGFPFPAGKARVYKVNPDNGNVRVYAKGFTNIIDVIAAPDGSLYVLEIAKNGLLEAEMGGDATGRLVRVSPNGRQKTIASEGLVAPTGVAIGKEGAVFVSNFGIFPGDGQVVKIPQ